MTKRLTALALAAVIALVVRGAQADCDYESHHLNTHNGVVPEWSYAHAVVSGAWESCADRAEAVACDHATGLECARELQAAYATCVGEEVCDVWIQRGLESSELVYDLSRGHELFESCVALVVSAGGEF